MSGAAKRFAFTFAAALARQESRHAQSPIRVGATLAQTGPTASGGQGALRGYQLCIKHVNEKGGVLGRPLELLARDDRSDPATAVRIYEQLITHQRLPEGNAVRR